MKSSLAPAAYTLSLRVIALDEGHASVDPAIAFRFVRFDVSAHFLGHFLDVPLANNSAVVYVSMAFLEGPSQHQQFIL